MLTHFELILRNKTTFNVTGGGQGFIAKYNFRELDPSAFAVDQKGMGQSYSNFINNNLGQNEWLGVNNIHLDITFNAVIEKQNINNFLTFMSKCNEVRAMYDLVLKIQYQGSSIPIYKDVAIESYKKGELDRAGVWIIPIKLNSIGGWYNIEEHNLVIDNAKTISIPTITTNTDNPGEIIIISPSKHTNLDIQNFLGTSSEASQRMNFKTTTNKQIIYSSFAKILYDEYGTVIEWEGNEAFEDVASAQIFIVPTGIPNNLKVTNLGFTKDAKMYIKIPTTII